MTYRVMTSPPFFLERYNAGSLDSAIFSRGLEMLTEFSGPHIPSSILITLEVETDTLERIQSGSLCKSIRISVGIIQNW